MVMFATTGANASIAFALFGIAAFVLGGLLHRLKSADLAPNRATLTFDEAPPTLELATSSTIEVEQLDEPNELVAGARYYLAGAALATVLGAHPRGTALTPLYDDCHARLFMYDEDRDRLVPVLLPDEVGQDDEDLRSTEEWEPGKGATGSAWDCGEFVYVTGDAIWDTTYGVTEEQAQRFGDLTAVASMPVTNAAGATIAVITATTRSPERAGLANETEAFETLLARAMLVSRVLVDLLGWFDDRYGGADGE